MFPFLHGHATFFAASKFCFQEKTNFPLVFQKHFSQSAMKCFTFSHLFSALSPVIILWVPQSGEILAIFRHPGDLLPILQTSGLQRRRNPRRNIMMTTMMMMMTMMMKAMTTVLEIASGMMLLRLQARAGNINSPYHKDSSQSLGK